MRWIVLLLIPYMLCADIEYFKSIPKAELHIHLGGAYPLEYLLSIASDEEKRALLDDLEKVSRRVSFSDVFEVFNIVAKIVNTEEKVQNGAESLCRWLAQDGVVYAEIRTGLKDLGGGHEAYLQAVLNGIERGSSENFQGRLILSLQRTSSAQMAKKTVDLAIKYKECGVVAIDVSGDSAIGQIETIIPELKRAKEAGLFLAVHMGESLHEVGQLEMLQALQPERIGHAVHLEPAAKEWILNHHVPVEVCLTSNYLCRVVGQVWEHPAIEWALKGHPIIIGSDDPLIFGTTLSRELQIVNEIMGVSLDEFVQMGFDLSFCAAPCPAR